MPTPAPRRTRSAWRQAPYSLSSSSVTDYGGNGLPLITSDITLIGLGAGAIIARDPAAPPFRLIHVKTSGALTVDNLTLQGGNGNSGNNEHGGAIYLEDETAAHHQRPMD